MRTLISSLVVVAACHGSASHGPAGNPPDAMYTLNCENETAFTVLTPRPGLHYDAALTVVADVDPFYLTHELGASIADDANNYYAPTAPPTTMMLMSGYAEVTWQFALAPGTRYQFYGFALDCDRLVDFFTSP
jgi:hypothetical protein